MKGKEIIKCAFCGGHGTNPFYRGTCPVCKGRGKNEVITPYISCRDCRGSGKKSGTTLTCYDCGGVGVVADTREDIKKARSEIREIQKEMEEEKSELYGKVNKKAIKTPRGWPRQTRTPPTVKEMKRRKKRQHPKEKPDEFDNFLERREASSGKYFCQSCAKEQTLSSAYKVCEECFFLYKFGKVRKIEPNQERKKRKKKKEKEEENEE